MKLFIVLVLALVLANTAPSVEARGRMFNSRNVAPQQFPSLVRLEINFQRVFVLCSGTLISNEWVLTAAHCVIENGIKAIRVKVFMGSVRRNVNESNVIIVVNANNLKIHEDYNRSGNSENDIALLKMSRQVQFNPNIQAAALPNSGNLNCEIENGLVAGHGVTNSNGDRPAVAQYNSFNVLVGYFCAGYFRKQLYDSQICLYGEDATVCLGDSGGPMYACNHLVGIGSYVSDNNCNSSSIMIYTNVRSFTNWIRAKTNIL